MKKNTFLAALFMTAISFGQGENATAFDHVKGTNSNLEECTAGAKNVIEYPNGWYNSGTTPDATYGGESTDVNWKWNHTVTDLTKIFFNGEGKTNVAYGTGDTDIDAIISIDNTTDFTLKAYNKRSASTNSSLTSCASITPTPGNKVVRFSLELITPFVSIGDVRTVTITITDTNGVVESIVLTATYDNSASLEDIDKFNFSYGPNPTSDVVRLSSAESINSIQVYNLLGQEVLRDQPEQRETSLDISNLNEGVYILKVAIKNEIGTFRIVKQ